MAREEFPNLSRESHVHFRYYHCVKFDWARNVCRTNSLTPDDRSAILAETSRASSKLAACSPRPLHVRIHGSFDTTSVVGSRYYPVCTLHVFITFDRS